MNVVEEDRSDEKSKVDDWGIDIRESAIEIRGMEWDGMKMTWIVVG